MDTKRISKDKGKCAVQNCPSTRQEHSHRFPKSTIIASRWIEAARSPRLIGLTPKQVCDNRYIICHLHFHPEDYQCSIRRKLKEGTVPSLLLPEETDSNSSSAEIDEKINVDRKEDSSHGITITSSCADFSPVTFGNSYQQSTGSNSNRQTCSLAAVESGNSIFATTPKSTICKFSRIESVNVLPGPSSQDENVHKVTKAGPSKRLIWQRERLDDSTRKMYEAVLQARKKMDNYKTKSLRCADRLKKVVNAKTEEFNKNIQDLSSLQCDFVNMIIRNAAPRRVRQLLSHIRLDCGVTRTMKDCLKEIANRMMEPLDKDKLVGLEDWGTKRAAKYADHALVFMLRGIRTGWKIPVAYNFCAAQTTHGQLIYCIKEVVRAITEAGFIVAATVCDQGSSNMKAIKTMQQDTDKIRNQKGIKKYWTILIDNVEFIPLYDVPHVLKCTRNNFLNKDVEIDFDAHLKDEDRKVASWNHIITAYEIDVHGDLIERHVPDITEQHVYPGKINKMKVKQYDAGFQRKDVLFRRPPCKSKWTDEDEYWRQEDAN